MYITDFGFASPSEVFSSAICVKKCPQIGVKALECKPTKEVANCNDPKILSAIYNTKNVLDYCFPASVDDLPKSFQNGWKAALKAFTSSSVGKNFNDMYLSSRAMYSSIGMGVVYSFVFIYLMSFFAEFISWIIIAFVQGGLWAATIGCYLVRQ